MWEGKITPYIKYDILRALFAVWRSKLQIGKKSVPCKEVILYKSRSRELEEWLLWSLPTQDASLCFPEDLPTRGAGQIDSMCRHLVWNKSGLTLYVPANLQPVWCCFLFFKAYILHTDFPCISKKNSPHQSPNSVITTLTKVGNLHTLHTLSLHHICISEGFVNCQESLSWLLWWGWCLIGRSCPFAMSLARVGKVTCAFPHPCNILK